MASLKLRCGDYVGLTTLDLTANRLIDTFGLEHLQGLESLVLDKNDLTTGFSLADTLPKLKHLSLRSCGLSSLDVTKMPNLETLMLDDNYIAYIDGLDSLHRLQTLSLRRQKLPKDTFVDIFSKRLDADTVLLSGNVLPHLNIITPCLSLRHLELAGVGLTELPARFGLSSPPRLG